MSCNAALSSKATTGRLLFWRGGKKAGGYALLPRNAGINVYGIKIRRTAHVNMKCRKIGVDGHFAGAAGALRHINQRLAGSGIGRRIKLMRIIMLTITRNAKCSRPA